MSYRFIFAAGLLMCATGASADHDTSNLDDDGCWNARKAAGGNCLDIKQHDWNGEIITVIYENNCSARIYVRSCHERTDKSKDCHEYGISGNRTAVHKTGSANGEVNYRAVGSLRSSNDNTCAARWRLRK